MQDVMLEVFRDRDTSPMTRPGGVFGIGWEPWFATWSPNIAANPLNGFGDEAAIPTILPEQEARDGQPDNYGKPHTSRRCWLCSWMSFVGK